MRTLRRQREAPLRTISLRRRVVTCSVVILASLLLVVGLVVDLTLGARLHADQVQRLKSLAVLAGQLNGTLSDQDLADRLTFPGVVATITDRSSSASTPVVGVPPVPGPAAGGRRPTPPPAKPSTQDDAAISVSSSGGRLIVSRVLDADRTLRLATDTATIDAALSQFRLLMTSAGLAGLLIAGFVTWWVLGRALIPLDVLTRTARAISGGDRGRRLGADRRDTELGRAATAFDEMLEELEGAERSAERARERLRAFLSDASHELRTPLAGISAGAEQLLLTDLTREQRDAVAAAVVRDSQRAARLVNDLLTVTRLDDESDRSHETAFITIDPAALAMAASERPSRLASSAVVELRLPPLGGSTVLGDPMQLDQVLANLLDNARHALADVPAAAPRIRLRMTMAQGEMRLRISDSGPGVPAEDRDRIFERLVRLDAARSRGTGGAGLGLPIARGLVAAHGGSLTCVDPDTTTGRHPDDEGDLPGAVFLLRLPLAPTATPPAHRSTSSLGPEERVRVQSRSALGRRPDPDRGLRPRLRNCAATTVLPAVQADPASAKD